MANIDDKVVAMSFEGSKFESGVNKTLSSLDRLKSSLKFDGVEKGFNNINRASQNVQLGRIAEGVDGVRRKLETLKLVGISVLGQLAGAAVRAGASFIKSFTFGPLQAGFQEYSTNLSSIQTILSNTAAQGTKLKDVNKALAELNRYSDLTIYNFGQMAKNIGTFTAAGVDLKTSTAAIKGIANLAALSGSSAEQASTAMYQLSQALAAGRVSLQDWNSVVNAGMGGAVFQRALANTAVAMGQLKDGAVKMVGPMKTLKINGESFRESIGGQGPKWLTSDVLTNTLKQFTNDMSAAQLKAQGFNDAQIKAIQTQAKMAMNAATQVKTFSQVLDVAKEAAGSGWAKTWQLIFGDFGEAKKTFTDLSNTINAFINRSADARNKVLADWKALGGRKVLIEGIKTAFQALGQILKPIKQAFRDIFPAKTGKDLFDLTVRFKELAEALKPSPETVDAIRRTFRGLFAVMDIGVQVVKGIFSMFGQLFRSIGGGNGGFLQLTARIGDFLVGLDEALKKGNVFNQFFVKMGAILAIPVNLLQQLAHAIANLFSGFSPGGFSGKMDSVSKPAIRFKQIIEDIGKALSGLGPAIGNAFSNINWEAVLQVVRTGLFGALVVMLRNFIGGTNLKQIFGIMGKNFGRSFGAGILGNISKAFGGLTGTLSAMQTELKARTLKEIAIAIALLVASVVALSLVDPDKLGGAIGAMTIMFGELLGAMLIIDKITNMPALLKLPVVSASLILLATAIDLLTISVFALSQLSWEELSKGLIGVGGLLVALAGASMVLSRNSAGMIRSSIGILGIAVAMKILASAMKDFGDMDWTQIAKGLVGVAGGLASIAATMQLMPKNMVLRSAAIVAISVALQLIARAMEKFGNMNWTQIGKGLAGVGGSLLVIAAAMHLMPRNMVLTAAGLVLVSLALGRIADAVQKMGAMSIKQIAKGIIGLAGALTALAIALNLMRGTLGGAIALGVAAAGMALLIPMIVLLGRQSWTTILKGLIGFGAALGVIAGAALLLSPSIPALLGFGAALVVIGAGLALAGAGIALIGVGLSAIAVSGTAAVGILVGALTSLVKSLVRIAKDLVLGILEITKTFAATAPQFVDALVKILNSLLDVVIKSSPKIGQAFQALLDVALKILQDNQAKIIQAGFSLLLALLRGISNNIGKVVTAVTDIIVKFLNAISNNLSRVVTAGLNVLINFLKGIANNITRVITAGTNIIISLVTGIINAYGRIITAGANAIVRLLNGIATKLPEVIRAGTNVIVNFITGIGNAGGRIVTAAVNAITKFIRQVAKGSVKLVDEGMKAIILFLNGVAKAINDNAGDMRKAGLRIAYAIADGMSFGLAGRAVGLAKQAANIGHSIWGAMKSAVGAHSPSRRTYEIGEYIMQGLSNGMSDNLRNIVGMAQSIGNSLISMFKNVFRITSPSKVMYEIGKYVGDGFAEGLRGSRENINEVFKDLNGKLTEAMRDARETIAKEEAKLAELRKAKKQDKEAIAEAQKILDENEAILARSTAGHNALVKTLKDEHIQLLKLTKNFEDVGEKLKAAQDILKDAIRTRDDAQKGFSDQYASLPELKFTDSEGNPIDPATVVSTYLKDLEGQTAAVGAYNSTLQQLRQLGLDDATYQKLLREGTADQSFANQLLAGGKTAVDALNTLDKQLATVSGTLATNAAKNLYQAGVDSAQGIVNGLESKRNALKKKMNSIANEILNELRRALKIKSPSQAFAEIGAYAMEGFAEGIFGNVNIMKNAVSDTVEETMAALKASMKKAVNTQGINMHPVITPVLDLSLVKAKAGELADLTDTSSFAQATAISNLQSSAETDAVAALAAGTSIKFEQNNYSPEALSEIEIYRQTSNQLSQLRSALAI